jgi:hypothetical protein
MKDVSNTRCRFTYQFTTNFLQNLFQNVAMVIASPWKGIAPIAYAISMVSPPLLQILDMQVGRDR